ncbi:MAG: hypothetical protein DCC75_12225, partial [Proteobacteria bacterium]
MDFFDEWLMQTDHPGLDASEPISDDEQRRIVRSHIVRITLEALFTAEYQIWAKSNQADLLKYSLETAHGKVDLNLPSALLKPWGSELIAADSGKLSFDPTKLLPLVVSDRSKKLKILSSIFTAKISDDFVALFDKASAQNLSRFEKALPKANWGSFHLGNLDFPEGGESRGLSYCIGIDAKNRPHVLGLWDSPDQSGPQWSKVSARLAELGIEQDRTHETEADSDGPDLNNDPTAEAEASDDPLIKSVEVRSHIPLDIAELEFDVGRPAVIAGRRAR